MAGGGKGSARDRFSTAGSPETLDNATGCSECKPPDKDPIRKTSSIVAAAGVKPPSTPGSPSAPQAAKGRPGPPETAL